MTLPRLSSIKTKVVAQNDYLKIALAAQELQSPLVQLPFSKKSLYISEPALIKQVWNEDILEKQTSVFDSLLHKNFIHHPEQINPWLPLLGDAAQNPSLEILVKNLHAAVDTNVKAWLNRRSFILQPAIDSTVFAYEICFDTLFTTFFEKDPKLEMAMRTWLENALSYTQKAWKVARYWPSPRRPFYFIAQHKIESLLREKIKNPSAYLKIFCEWNEKNNILSTDDLVAFILFGFLVAHQSLSNLLSATFYELAKNRGIRLYVEKEIKNTFQGRLPENSDFGKLFAVPLVTDEILRLFPPVTWMHLKLKKETQIGDTLVAQSTQVYASPFAMHRDTRFWPTGATFDPAVSFDEPKRRDNSFLPFGVLPGNASMEVISMTLISFALIRLLQTAELSLPMINKLPHFSPYFGVKFDGDTAIKISKLE